MAIFTKPIDKGIPPQERRQVVLSSELNTGDIIDVTQVLGNSPAKLIKITTDGSADLSIRYNVLRKVYPSRGLNDGFGTPADLPYDHIGNEVLVTDLSMDSVSIGINKDAEDLSTGPVKSIEVVWTTGTWSMQLFG